MVSETEQSTGEWSCLISFAWASSSCEEREASKQLKIKNVYIGIRTNSLPHRNLTPYTDADADSND